MNSVIREECDNIRFKLCSVYSNLSIYSVKIVNAKRMLLDLTQRQFKDVTRVDKLDIASIGDDLTLGKLSEMLYNTDRVIADVNKLENIVEKQELELESIKISSKKKKKDYDKLQKKLTKLRTNKNEKEIQEIKQMLGHLFKD